MVPSLQYVTAEPIFTVKQRTDDEQTRPAGRAQKALTREDLTTTSSVHSFHLSTDSFLSTVLHLDSDPQRQCDVRPPYSSPTVFKTDKAECGGAHL